VTISSALAIGGTRSATRLGRAIQSLTALLAIRTSIQLAPGPLVALAAVVEAVVEAVVVVARLSGMAVGGRTTKPWGCLGG